MQSWPLLHVYTHMKINIYTKHKTDSATNIQKKIHDRNLLLKHM